MMNIVSNSFWDPGRMILHEWLHIFMVNVGKYSSHMQHLGKIGDQKTYSP